MNKLSSENQSANITHKIYIYIETDKYKEDY